MNAPGRRPGAGSASECAAPTPGRTAQCPGVGHAGCDVDARCRVAPRLPPRTPAGLPERKSGCGGRGPCSWRPGGSRTCSASPSNSGCSPWTSCGTTRCAPGPTLVDTASRRMWASSCRPGPSQPLGRLRAPSRGQGLVGRRSTAVPRRAGSFEWLIPPDGTGDLHAAVPLELALQRANGTLAVSHPRPEGDRDTPRRRAERFTSPAGHGVRGQQVRCRASAGTGAWSARPASPRRSRAGHAALSKGLEAAKEAHSTATTSRCSGNHPPLTRHSPTSWS